MGSSDAQPGMQIQKVVGERLIDRNRVVFEECNTYEELLDDVRTSKVQAAEKNQAVRGSRQFSLVEQEVSLWIERLRDTLSQVSGMPALSTLSARDAGLKGQSSQRVMAYVRSQHSLVRAFPTESCRTGTHQKEKEKNSVQRPLLLLQRSSVQGSALRPMSAAGLSSMSRPSICATGRPSTASSHSSRASLASAYQPRGNELSHDAQGKTLDAYNVDAVKGDIQAALHEEHAALLEDVEYLQALMNDDLDAAAAAQAQPPELQEMQAFVSHIRDITLHEEEQLAHVKRVDSMLHAAQAGPSRLLSLRTQVSISRRPTAPAHDCLHRAAVHASGVQEKHSPRPLTAGQLPPLSFPGKRL